MMMIDKLAYSSPWRYKSTHLKSCFAIGTLLICVAVRSFLVSSVILALMGCLTVTYSQASLSRYGKMMLWPLGFLMLGTIAVFFDVAGEPMGLLHVAIGSKYIVMLTESLAYGARLILVSLASVSCLYFLILTTTMPDLMDGLKRLHLPWLVIELMTLIYRFIFVLLDSALAITTAQNCRLGNRNLRTSIRSMGGMLAALFIQAMGKSSALFDSMEARCYEGRIRVLTEHRPAAKKEVLLVAAYLTGLLALAVFCHMKGGL
ncbi:cobalt ECF transporter T component CbiQ [Anaerovorax odorimutans]|uniref:Cobalt ECF transporter T component CbiQ n=1 Tax=Anaerovorax odorimutans TaxID=109327 RepID=A0ABT1RMH4_9FIRM|nr:cobalt ECF transporter T component CbiQ [Anaerovorax odorimutans]MCQ4636383.1 cobalt ECF transporter T component CbiQ [Anaerovorax odorimutans]